MQILELKEEQIEKSRLELALRRLEKALGTALIRKQEENTRLKARVAKLEEDNLRLLAILTRSEEGGDELGINREAPRESMGVRIKSLFE